METCREYPVKFLWYGKGARYKSIEELIDNDPTLFLWYVERFQDVTPAQAKHFKEKYDMDLPEEVIADVPPYEHIHIKGDKGMDEKYMQLCEEYAKQRSSSKG